jgi:hypothetical protein
VPGKPDYAAYSGQGKQSAPIEERIRRQPPFPLFINQKKIKKTTIF